MRRRALAGLTAAAGFATAGAIAQKRLLASIAADPENERLRRPLGGEELAVAAADGTELHAEAFGPADAPKLILAHGWMCAIEFWRYQIDELAGDFRVIAYDQRGHGKSAEADDYSFGAFSADFGTILDAFVPVGERALVAGHSMGAMTIAAWAGDNPDKVANRLSGALLFNTGLGDLITESVILRTPERLTGLRDPIGRLMMTAALPIPATPSPIGDAAVRYVAMNPDASPARVAFVRRMALTCNPKARSKAGATMARMDLWKSVESLDTPTVVIAGRADKMTPLPHAMKLFESLPKPIELVKLPGIGHMAPIETPTTCNQTIRELGNAVKSGGGVPRSRVLRPVA
ncbi:MAG: alpha/beta fold hydrolase [Solirubrobacterales bacterium]